MERPDSLSTRRAVLAGLGTVTVGSGVVYAGSRLDSDPNGNSSSAGVPRFHASSETTGFGIELSGHPIMGDRDAPLDMYYWSDYQCPFCRRFESETFPALVDEHVEAGTVRVVFIEYPYLSEGSVTAAVMDRCVWRRVREDRPRRYWAWHSAVFDAQQQRGSGWATSENLLEVTREVDGIDAGAVGDCVDADRPAIEASIADDVEQARGLGLRGSPAFVIYDQSSDETVRLVGAQPYERFDEAIDTVANT